MKISDRSSWREEKALRGFPPLQKTAVVDVAIIGGGITGITAAYLLRNSHKSIAVLERGRVGDWATGSTTGFLMEALDTDPSQLIHQYGRERAEEIITSHRDAISLIEKISAEEKIECEFKRCPAFVYAQTQKETQALKKEVEKFVQLGTKVSYSQKALPFETCAHLQIEKQAKFHPLKYLFGLAEAVQKSGVHIHEMSEVESVKAENLYILLTLTNGAVVKAGQVLVATHNPFMRPQPLKIRFKKAWYTTYVIEALLPRGSLPEALYEDSEIPYHYMRIDNTEGGDRLIIGGEDHRSDIKVDERKSFTALEAYLKQLRLSFKYAITREWKGRIVEPGDGLPYIGTLNEQRIYYATGYSGNGLTAATIAAHMFHDHVLKLPNSLQAIYAADRRFSLKQYLPKALEYI